MSSPQARETGDGTKRQGFDANNNDLHPPHAAVEYVVLDELRQTVDIYRALTAL